MNRRNFTARGDTLRVGLVRRRAMQLCAAAALLGAGVVSAQMAITAHAIAGGGGTVRSAGGCYVLNATLGEPAVGRSSGGAFAISAGFQAGPGNVRRDQLFRGGFQECN